MESLVNPSSALLGDVVTTTQLRSNEWLRLMWGFFWRGVAFTVASALGGGIVGGVVGAVVGLVMGFAGATLEQIRAIISIVGMVLGLGVGFFMLRWYIAWLLGGRYGNLRLQIVRLGSERIVVSSPASIEASTSEAP